jgi:nucleoside-diphosphate-sugar epimerase
VKYLVTGATGFIGRELCRQLSLRGADFVALSRSGRELADGGPSLALDLADSTVPASLLRGVDVVFHLAGVAHQQAADAAYQRVNCEATLALAQASAAAGVRCFVFLSSVKAMGLAVDGRARAEADCNPPVDAYGRSKWQAECALHECFSAAAMGVVILRPTLVYGSVPKGNLALLAAAVRKGLPRPPELGGRSMVAAQDLATLMCTLGEQPPAGVHTWIVSDGQTYSARRICDAMRGALDRGPGVGWCPLWVWRLAAAAMDIGRNSGSESSFDKLFGCERYSNEAILADFSWRPQLRLEDIVGAMLPASQPSRESDR